VPGLKGDPVEADAGSGCCSGMSGAHRVAGDPFGGHASSTGSGPQHPGDGFAGDRFIGGEPVAEAGEQRTGRISTDGRPSRQGRDGGGDRVLPVGDADHLAAAIGVGLGAPYVQEEAAGFGIDVGEREAVSSERRKAEAMPSRMIAASRAPLAPARSIPATIRRMSAVSRGLASRGAVPRVRRRPRRTCRTASVRIGSSSP